MAEAALEVINVRQIFRQGFWLKPVEVLKGISFEVPAKSIFGFLGANGAGKTTLIHLITGLRNPTAGKIRIFGAKSDTLEARMRIGFLPERPYFQDFLTAEGLLKYYAALSGVSSKKAAERIVEVLSLVGLKDFHKLELKRFSKGMLQRIGIAQALLHNPELLILDEPMSGLDPVGRKEMRELMIRLAEQGKTLFFSSHIIPDVEAICDRIALIQKGKLKGSGRMEDFLRTEGAHVEIVFQGTMTEQFKTWSVIDSFREVTPQTFGVTSLTQHTNEILARVLKSGGNIISVTPVRPSLESLFEGSKK